MAYYKVMYILILLTISLFVAQKLMDIQNEEVEKELVGQANNTFISDSETLPQGDKNKPENNADKKQDVNENTKTQTQ